MIAQAVAIGAGILAGTFTGMVPGIHVNLVAATALSFYPLVTGLVSPILIGLFIFSTAITHTFVDAIPSTLLGVPNPDTVEMILPAHRMVIKGEGYGAVRLATMGGLVSLIVGVILFPLLIPLMVAGQEIITDLVGWVLIAVSAYFILTEQERNKKFWALIIFLASGALGSIVLSAPALEHPLLPMLSGLFGLSTVLISLKDEVVDEVQMVDDPESFTIKKWARTVITSIIAAILAAFLPGLGTAQSTMMAKSVLPKDPRLFLVAAGGINTLSYLFSLATWFAVDKARNGAVVAIKEVIKGSMENIGVLVIASVVVGGVATLITLVLARVMIKVMQQVSYQKIAMMIMLILVLLVGVLSGLVGLLVMMVATSLGMLTQVLGIRKSAAMGCLVIPVIVFLLG